jgi:regulator of PEP synthase PpsR (kinase-PPPase family)
VTNTEQARQPDNVPPVFIVSGGIGASGEQLVNTVLAQFQDNHVPVTTVGNVRRMEEIAEIVKRAKASNGTIVHTMVDARLRRGLSELAIAQGVVAIDLVGPLLSRLAEVLGREPLGEPGRYRRLHRADFQRVAAIEYTMRHDDGQNPEGWSEADIVLVGVSRTGKTPLSIYLSVLGWKVANVPIALDWQPPARLFALDRRRVVGLTIDADQLIMLRRQRFSRIGARAPSAYIDPEEIRRELNHALRIIRTNRFALIDVTDKPIETSADEVIKWIAGANPNPSS